MTSTTTVSLDYISDEEGFGVCGLCDREGLRWLCHLSDGSVVGLECAKRMMGVKPSPKTYTWMDGYTLTATHTEYGQTWALYTRANGVTAMTLHGVPQQFGNARETWTQRGWAV